MLTQLVNQHSRLSEGRCACDNTNKYHLPFHTKSKNTTHETEIS
jgi:hypothetical protein